MDGAEPAALLRRQRLYPNKPLVSCNWYSHAHGRLTYAASSWTLTRHPSAVAMFTSASREKRETRPRSRSFIRGCVTPQWLAASVCVHPRWFTSAAICRISSARAAKLAACSGVSAMASHTLLKSSDLVICHLLQVERIVTWQCRYHGSKSFGSFSERHAERRQRLLGEPHTLLYMLR